MSAWWSNAVDVALALTPPLAAVPALLLIKAALDRLWRLPLAVRLRPRTAWWIVVPLFVGVVLVLGMLLGPGHPYGILLAALLLVPWPALWCISYLAWRTDAGDAHAAAAAIRNERAAPLVGRGRHWSGYVFDAERARRRAAYVPPPI